MLFDSPHVNRDRQPCTAHRCGNDGFGFVEVFDMTIKKKQYGMNYNNDKGNINNKEPVMVFKKIK